MVADARSLGCVVDVPVLGVGWVDSNNGYSIFSGEYHVEWEKQLRQRVWVDRGRVVPLPATEKKDPARHWGSPLFE